MSAKKEASTLRILLKTIADLNLSFERKNISNIVVEGLQRFLNLDSSFFYSLDAGRSFFTLEAALGNYIEKDKVPMGHGFVGWVGEHCEILTVKDNEKGGENLIVAPVKAKRGLLGVIGGRKKGKPFSDTEKELINLFATQVGTVMENYIYYHRLQRSKDFRDCILYNIPSGIIIVNPDWRIKTYNQSAIYILGEKNIGKGLEIYKVLSNEILVNAIKETFAGRGPFRNLEISFGNKFFNVTVVPVKGMALDGDDIMIVLDDVTELRRAYQEKERAKRFSTIGQFASAIAHELRNPLTGINILLEMLKESKNLEQRQRETIDKILSEIAQLEEMIKSILEISKPQELRLEAQCLNNILMEFVEMIGEMARKRGIELVAKLPKVKLVVMADKKKIFQVLRNLFNNSVESMKEGGVFTLTLKKKGSSAEILIRDTGTGIPLEYQDKIFEPFFTTKETGTGLGLYITKNIIEQHKGKIDVKSDGKSGTEFKIDLPLGEIKK